MACSAVTQRCAPIWVRAFHDHALRADEDLLTVARYVVSNPVRVGLVNNVLEYSRWDAEWM